MIVYYAFHFIFIIHNHNLQEIYIYIHLYNIYIDKHILYFNESMYCYLFHMHDCNVPTLYACILGQ